MKEELIQPEKENIESYKKIQAKRKMNEHRLR